QMGDPEIDVQGGDQPASQAIIAVTFVRSSGIWGEGTEMDTCATTDPPCPYAYVVCSTYISNPQALCNWASADGTWGFGYTDAAGFHLSNDPDQITCFRCPRNPGPSPQPILLQIQQDDVLHGYAHPAGGDISLPQTAKDDTTYGRKTILVQPEGTATSGPHH